MLAIVNSFNEEGIEKVCITFVCLTVHNKNAIGVSLQTRSINTKLTLILAWVSDFKNSHWFTLLDKMTATQTLNEAILNFVGVIFPLATVITLGVVEINGALPRHDLFSKFVVEPSLFHLHSLHLNRERNSIFGVLI